MLFAKFELASHVPELDRVLFLDSDVIVKADLRNLYGMRMQHEMAAANTQISWAEWRHYITTAEGGRGLIPRLHRLLPNLSSTALIPAGGVY